MRQDQVARLRSCKSSRDARQRAWINECAAVTDKLAHIQELEQLEEMSVCHVEEDAWQEASSEAGEQGIEEKHRIEAVEQDTEAKYSMQRAVPGCGGRRVRRRPNPRLRASWT